jgi:RsiW-degrading membrane proteinase PrsW (M82 family)
MAYLNMELLQNPKALLFAILSGAIPAIFWLWFWLKEEEDSNEHEPIGLIIVSFILGGLLVFIAILLEKYSLNFITNNSVQIIVWASIEEILKFLGVMVIISGNSNVNRPIDYPMYFIAVALGFAALENILYLLNPFIVNETLVGIFTGNLRFLGSTLLHAISSAMIGSALGLAIYLKKYKAIYVFIGIILAITLHSIFNFFIMKGSGENFLSVFGFLWIVTIINILVFEKLKRIGKDIPITN